jgi:tetratricopeptide (TPR) repeat protein
MPLTLKPFHKFCLALGLALSACNIFNPSGDGTVGDNPDALLSQGEDQFRKQDYPSAMESFSKAIAADSNNSLAYYGYAKACMRYWQVNASTLLTEVDKIKNKTGLPFIGSDNWTVTKYLQASSRVRKALGTLTDRDTLTRWYNYTLDPDGLAASKDPHKADRIAFMEDYWKQAEQGAKGFRPKSQFPLSDLKLGYDKVIGDFGFVELIYAITHLKDLDANDTIDSRDNLLNLIDFSVDKGLKLDNLKDVGEQLNDSANRKNMNQLIQNVSSGLGSAGNVVDLLGPILAQQGGGDSTDTAGLQDKVSQNMKSVIDSMGDGITFYQFGDGKDNDGDGCIDEEILDNIDNDGDGVVDEDARVKPVIIGDDIDNDHNGIMDASDPDEGLNGENKLRFTAAAGFVKGPQYADKKLKVWVQKDSLDTKSVLTPADKAVLDSAKRAIGGCWNNY